MPTLVRTRLGRARFREALAWRASGFPTKLEQSE